MFTRPPSGMVDNDLGVESDVWLHFILRPRLSQAHVWQWSDLPESLIFGHMSTKWFLSRICQENLTSGKLRVKFNYSILYGYFYCISVNCIHITYICITLTGGTFCRARAYASSVYCLQRFEASKHTPRWARPCQDIRLRVGLWFFKKEATCISVST